MSINDATDMLNNTAKALAERQGRYGAPNKNFTNIAALWTAHLRGRYGELATIALDEADVAVMSAMIKMARLAETPDHEDSWVDLAGYAACGFQVTRAFAPGALGDTTEMQTTGPLPVRTEMQDGHAVESVYVYVYGLPYPTTGFTYSGDLGELDAMALIEQAEALAHDISDNIFHLFEMGCTSQGFDYWSSRRICPQLITSEDRAYLLWLAIQAVHNNKKKGISS
jgi:Domain of unknown function (DUF6378)